MEKITFERFETECTHNNDINSGKYTGRKIYSFKVLVDGEHRATWVPYIYKMGYHLVDLENRDIAIRYSRMGRDRSAKAQRFFEQEFLSAWEGGEVPSPEQIAQRKIREAEEAEVRRVELQKHQRIKRIKEAGPELLAALEGVLRVADCATVEFDAARAAIAKANGE